MHKNDDGFLFSKNPSSFYYVGRILEKDGWENMGK